MSQNQLHNEAVTLLMAGYESTASNLAWTFHLLRQHPAVLRELEDEILGVLGRRKPTYADVKQLALSRRVLQESLRLFAPSYWTQRQAEHDDEIDGSRIKAGTIVAPMVYLIHHHPETWAVPFEFDPDRFLPEQVASRHAMAWLPFGAGQRKCIAIEFALMKGQLVLARILQRFCVRGLSKLPPKMDVGSNVRPRAGGLFEVKQRTEPDGG